VCVVVVGGGVARFYRFDSSDVFLCHVTRWMHYREVLHLLDLTWLKNLVSVSRLTITASKDIVTSLKTSLLRTQFHLGERSPVWILANDPRPRAVICGVHLLSKPLHFSLYPFPFR
jgi:hypothetical protein